ncbi:MAG: hypothetical protein E6G97_21830 [Alphaproteobacteria bacterium]|nr:MAG: hypothetical protein E6G97_21830 [Alphaproteobacteria bacterium]
MHILDLVDGPLTGRRLRTIDDTSEPAARPISRRAFLSSSLATSGAALAPTRAFGFSSPLFRIDETTFAVSWRNQEWTIDCAAFDGNPVLNVVNEGSGYRGTLRQAKFASTGLSADLDFEIARSGAGELHLLLRIPALGIDASSSLEHWLSGKASFPVTDMPQQLTGGSGLGRFEIRAMPRSLNHLWRLDFGAGSARLGKREFTSDAFSLLVCTQDKSLQTRSEINASLARLTDPDDWLRAKQGIRAAPVLESALRLRYQISSAKFASLVVEPESASDQLTVLIATTERGFGRIQVENYRIAEVFDGRSVKRTLVGDIALAGSRLEAGGLRFDLSGIGHTGRFMAETTGPRLTRLDCAPSAIASSVPVEGALTSTFPLSIPQPIRFAGPPDDAGEAAPGPRMRLAQARSSQSDAPDFLTPGQGPGVATGNVVCSGCALPGKPQELRYFSTHAIRAEDLLWLGFEFYNFELKAPKKGKKYLAPLKVPGPALVIVHLPPQHILEDAFNEDIGCPKPTPKISFPIDAKSSGPSRLVFEFPADEDRLDLTLDALTDWRRWKIKKVPDSRHSQLIRAPLWDETAIEAPTCGYIAPAPGVSMSSPNGTSIRTDPAWPTALTRSGASIFASARISICRISRSNRTNRT